MTIPWQHNCPHSPSDWCLECVRGLGEENARLQRDLDAAIDVMVENNLTLEQTLGKPLRLSVVNAILEDAIRHIADRDIRDHHDWRHAFLWCVERAKYALIEMKGRDTDGPAEPTTPAPGSATAVSPVPGGE